MAEVLGGSPVFIGGDGRSGTTLLGVILDSHPQLAVGSELHFLGPPNLGPYILDGIRLLRAGDARLTETGIRSYPEYRSVLRFVRRCERFGVALDPLEDLIRSAIAKTGTDLSNFEHRCVLIDSLGRHIARAAGKPRWGMKLMRAIKNLPRYAEVWPEARFVHIIRDGRDVAASQIRDHSSWGYSSIEIAAERWPKLVTTIHSYQSAHRLFELRYEDVVAAPESSLRSLADFLNVPWDESMLRHSQVEHGLLRSGVQHPSHDAVSRPINSSAVGRFRHDLTPQEIDAFEAVAGPVLDEFGYTRDTLARG